MAASTDPNKIVGALDTMGSSLDVSSPAPTTSLPKFATIKPTGVSEGSGFLPAPSPSPAPTPTPSPAPAQPYSIPAANENDSVQGRVAGLISNNSDLMKLASAQGQQFANRRGLQNSSVAAGASQAEVLKAATPIATADANIAAQKNLGREAQASSMEQLRQQLASSDSQQAKSIASQMALLQTQLGSASDLQKADIQAQMDRLTTQGKQALGLQGASDTGAMTRLQAQLSASSSQQDKDLAAQMARVQTDAAAQMSRLQSQLTNADAQQQVAIKAQMDQLTAQSQAQLTAMAAQSGYDVTKLQVASGLDVARDAAQAKNQTDLAKVQGSIQSALQSQGNSEQIQRMGVDLQNQLQVQGGQLAVDLKKISAAGDQDIRRLVEAANQERVTLQQSIAAQDRDRMATAMVNTFQIEAQMRAALLGNNNIPASERAGYEQSISALGDPIRAYINQLFGTGAAPASSTVTPAGPTAPVGPTTPPVGSPSVTPPEGTPTPDNPVITAPSGGLLQDTSPLGNQMATLPASVLNSNGAPITSTTPITTTYPTTGGLIPNIGGLTSDERRQLGMAIQ